MVRWAGLLSLLLAVVGCASAPPPAIVPSEPGAAHPADELPIAARLPRTTRALLVTGSLEGLLAALGRQVLLRRLRPEAEALSFELIQLFGFDPTDPADLARFGVAAQGEAALAMLADGAGALALTLADPARFKAEMYRVAALRADRAPVVSGAAVLLPGPPSLLLGERTALLFFGDGSEAAAREALELAREDSLAAHRPFRAALRAVDPAADLRAYVDLRALHFEQLGLDPRAAGSSRDDALRALELEHRRALMRARARGQSVDELVAIDQAHRRARDQLDDDVRAERHRRLVGGIEGIGLALRVRRDGFELEGAIAVAADSPWRRLLGNADRVMPLLGALADPPALLVRARLDPAALLAEESAFGLARHLPLGLAAAEVASLLDGDVGVALSYDPPARARDGAGERLELAVMLGLANPDRMRALLDRLSEGGEKSERPVARINDGWRLRLGGRSLECRIVGGHLVVADDPALAARLARSASVPKRDRALASIEDSRAAADIAVALAPVLTWLRSEAEPPVEVSIEEPADEPEERLALRRELEAVGRQIDELRGRMALHREALLHQALLPLGTAAFSLHETDWGFRLRSTYAAGKRPAAALARALRALSDPPEDEVLRAASRRLRALEARRDALERHLWP